ncbi:helix-turn-helix domain-containing protein [uncultured Bosea sp.]|uniref:helix-turn-helix domain-containing protein n=1 Tax=uncultured Bosea sp. TaxID=211457 RepID=UPI00263BD6E5|nr:helix-turn-helix domain-containing protein [uncultured Bosea sp.]
MSAKPKTSSANDGRLAYSPEEAARLTGVSRAFLYLEMQRGKLTSIKIGRRRLIRRSDLLAWVGEAEHAA